MKVDLQQVEEAAKELYIRALKMLPPDIKQGFDAPRPRARPTPPAKAMLGTMIKNIAVAEDTDNLLCQDTGIPIYNVTIGRGVEVDGFGLKQAIRNGCERATREHPLRSSVVHPVTRKNEHTSCGRGVPVIHIDFADAADTLVDRDDPEGQRLGEQFLAQDGGSGRRHRRDQDLRRRLRARRGRQDLPADHRRRRRRRHRGPVRAPGQGRGDARRSARTAAIRRAPSSRRSSRARGEPARRRPAGPGRRFDGVRGARRDSRRRTSP